MFRRQIIGVARSLGVLNMVCDYYIYDLKHTCAVTGRTFSREMHTLCSRCFILVVIFK